MAVVVEEREREREGKGMIGAEFAKYEGCERGL